MKLLVPFLLALLVACVTSQGILGILSNRLCRQPRIPRNGRIMFTGKGSLRTSSLRYICDTNYRLDGFRVNICRDNRWIFATPRCEEIDPCSDRRACASNARCISGRGQSFTCRCNRGYSGNATTRCARNCRTPSSFRATYSPRNRRGYVDGFRISWSCDRGYTERSRTVRTQLCSLGRWIGRRPTCLRNVCNSPTAPTNGKVNPQYSSWISGDVAQFSCNPGYELVGESSIRCRSSRSFNSLPTCTDINECEGDTMCGDNAYCMNTQSSYLCVCNDGYEGDGMICNDTNECDDGMTRCSANSTCVNTSGSFVCICNDEYTGMDCVGTCELPAIPENVLVELSDRDFFLDGETLMFSCMGNMTLIGSEVLACENGDFGPVPICTDL